MSEQKKQSNKGSKKNQNRINDHRKTGQQTHANQRNAVKQQNKIKQSNRVDKTGGQAVLCPVDKKCGGCQLLRVSYEEQIRQKQRFVEQQLKGICKVEAIIGMEQPLHYRNKVHAVFDIDRRGNVISGIYQEGTHHVVPVEKCLIEDERADGIIGTVRGLLKSFRIKTYDEDTGYGLLRHVLVRVGKKSGQVMVVLVTGSPIFPSKNNFVKALRDKHPEITTVVLNINDKKTSMVLGERNITLYGPGYIEDELCGCIFRISPSSFYQVNPVQTEVLYNTAIEFAGLTGKERVLDAYCGIGTIGLIAASRGAKEVVGVELNSDAVKDARVNAKRNQIKNAVFYAGDAGEFMVHQAQEKDAAIDVVFMDPPRSGSNQAFLNSLVKLAPPKVVYVSCNPETLARDLKYLTGKGYQVKRCVACDMFPMTEHVETCVLLSQKKPDGHIHVKVKFDEAKAK